MSIGIPRIRDANTEDLTGTKTLVAGDAYHQILDANGSSRNLVCPAGPTTQGGEFMLTNSGGEDITVQQSDASTTVAVVASTESAMFVCNGDAATNAWQTVGIAET